MARLTVTLDLSGADDPIGHPDRVNIRFHTFGSTHNNVRGEAAANEVVAALEGFLADLRKRIVDAG